MAAMDPQEVFAAFRASCWQKTRVIWDFITGRENFDIDVREALELREMRRVLRAQLACMEETWDDLLRCVTIYANDCDNNPVFGDLKGVMESTRRVVD